MKYTPAVRTYFPDEIANLANVLIRYGTTQTPGFVAGVRALAEACGVDGSDLIAIDHDLMAEIDGIAERVHD